MELQFFNPVRIRFLLVIFIIGLVGCVDDESNSSSTEEGVSGSTARMILIGDAVYALSHYELKRIDISNLSEPEITDELTIESDVETITSDGDGGIFLGSPTRVYSYLYQPDSGLNFAGMAERVVTGIDPVVTDGNFAYSTLREGEFNEFSGTFESRGGLLFIYSINENKTLTEVSQYRGLGAPAGLSIWNDTLLICDEYYGIMQWDVQDRANANMLLRNPDIKCKDVLHLGDGHFVTVGSDGIYQMKPDEQNNIALISIHQ